MGIATEIQGGLEALQRKEREATMRKLMLFGLAMVLMLAAASADAQAQAQGFIKARTGETLLIQTGQGEVTALLTDDTKVVDKRGLFGLSKQQLSLTVLIPGLKVKVEGPNNDKGQIVAQKITTDGDDLEASQMVQAGLHPTAEQVRKNTEMLEQHAAQLAGHKEKIETNAANIEANRQQISANMANIEAHTQRFMALTEYDVKAQETVNFAVGSAKISKADEDKLKAVAETAKGLTGYIIEIVGFADSTGDPARNTKLSGQRAQAVATFLFQQGGIPVRHIVAPGAMGEYGAAASNETKQGRAENRRVEVKVLVNKGLAGS